MFRPVIPGDIHLIISSEVSNMAMAFRRREFLNPEFTGHTSHILAEIESTYNGVMMFGTNTIMIADCKRSVRLEFFLGNPESRVNSLQKLDLLIGIFIQYRECLQTQIDLIEKAPIKKVRNRSRS
jgi:hypothetical protein